MDTAPAALLDAEALTRLVVNADPPVTVYVIVAGVAEIVVNDPLMSVTKAGGVYIDVIVAPTVVVIRIVVVELVVLSLPKYTMLLIVVVVGPASG